MSAVSCLEFFFRICICHRCVKPAQVGGGAGIQLGFYGTKNLLFLFLSDFSILSSGRALSTNSKVLMARTLMII